MSADPTKPVVLTTVPSEMIASLLIGRLQDEGIHAQSVGGIIAGFRAETPARVQILVLARDEARARELLSQWQIKEK